MTDQADDPIDGVIEAFDDLIAGSMISRAAAGARAVGALQRLSAEDRRELVARVSERVAPDLVDHVREQTGAELSEDQLRGVVEAAERLDAEDLRALRADLRDPERRRETLGEAGRAAAAGVAGVVDDDAGPDGAVAGDAELQSLESELEQLRAERDRIAEELDPPGSGADAPSTDTPDTASSGTADTDPDPGTPAADTTARAPEPPGSGTAGPAAEQDVVQPPPPPAPPEPADDPGPSAPLPRAGPTSPPGGRAGPPEPSPRPGRPGTARDRADGADALPGRIAAAGSAHAGLGLLRLHAGTLATTDDAGQRAAAVRAVPDGWARRRALRDLLGRAPLATGEIRALVSTLDREGDRRWVVGDLVASGRVTPDQVAGLVEPAALARIAARDQRTASGSSARGSSSTPTTR